jgi:DNA-binding transcriptional MerR regulator
MTAAPAPAATTEWLRLSEASHRLRLSVDQVRRYADRGVLVSQRGSLGRVVSAADVDRLARERAGRGPAPAA